MALAAESSGCFGPGVEDVVGKVCRDGWTTSLLHQGIWKRVSTGKRVDRAGWENKLNKEARVWNTLGACCTEFFFFLGFNSSSAGTAIWGTTASSKGLVSCFLTDSSSIS